MKRLTLLRHAKSSWDNRRLADHDRPLAGRGRRDAPRMGQRLAAHGLKPDLLLCSTARRARETAELVAPPLGAPPVAHDADIYLATPGALLAVLARQDDAVDELVMIGHNPGFTELANMLLPGLRLGNLPTAGAVALTADAATWRDFDSAAYALRFYDYPKNPEPAS